MNTVENKAQFVDQGHAVLSEINWGSTCIVMQYVLLLN